MKKAWMESTKIRDICFGIPHESYAPEIAAFYATDVPDNAENGDTWDGLTLTKPVVPAPVPVAPSAQTLPVLTPIQYYLAFTPQERIAIKSSIDPIIKEAWETYQLSVQLNSSIDPNLVSVTGALQYMTTTTPPILTAARIPQIMAGKAQ